MSYEAWVHYIGDEDAALDLWNDAMDSEPIPKVEPSERCKQENANYRAALAYVRALAPWGRPIW
jgi:hypothetical protein